MPLTALVRKLADEHRVSLWHIAVPTARHGLTGATSPACHRSGSTSPTPTGISPTTEHTTHRSPRPRLDAERAARRAHIAELYGLAKKTVRLLQDDDLDGSVDSDRVAELVTGALANALGPGRTDLDAEELIEVVMLLLSQPELMPAWPAAQTGYCLHIDCTRAAGIRKHAFTCDNAGARYCD